MGLLTQTAFLFPFAICVVISVAVLWFTSTRNPIRQFRPPMGQIALHAVVLLMVSGGVSYMVSRTILEGNEVVRQMEEMETEKYEERNDALIDDGSTRGGSWDRIMNAGQVEPPDEEEGPNPLLDPGGE